MHYDRLCDMAKIMYDSRAQLEEGLSIITEQRLEGGWLAGREDESERALFDMRISIAKLMMGSHDSSSGTYSPLKVSVHHAYEVRYLKVARAMRHVC